MSTVLLLRSAARCAFAMAVFLPLAGCMGQAPQNDKAAKGDASKAPENASQAPKDGKAAPDSKVTKDNADKVKNGMTVAEVEEILGPGTKLAASEVQVKKLPGGMQFGQDLKKLLQSGGTGLKWEDGNKSVRIGFQNGKAAIINKSSF
jgi:hypothetical protein